ncbi:hypothetical protein GH733_007110 [Mirounga leonina]|nr:hypothetical protein GH733_007110 [Mirounga leonina]
MQMAKLYQNDQQFVDMPLSSAPGRGSWGPPDPSLPPGPPTRFCSALVSWPLPTTQAPPTAAAGFRARALPGRGAGAAVLDSCGLEGQSRFLQKISDPKLRAWAGQLHQLWKKLGKKPQSQNSCTGRQGRHTAGPVRPEVLSQPGQFSLIYSAHPFSVPGGRLVEFYCWDSYWVMEGLLLSEMPGMVKGMLHNFLDLVQIYGKVPNGARVYYLQPSQPPLLTLTMDRYVTHTDTAFLRWAPRPPCCPAGRPTWDLPGWD